MSTKKSVLNVIIIIDEKTTKHQIYDKMINSN
jgi:hypothetical protein